MATTLIRQADFRVANGLAVADTRMGHDNAVTQMLARRLGLPVPNLSPDYIAHRSGVAAGRDSAVPPRVDKPTATVRNSTPDRSAPHRIAPHRQSIPARSR